MVSIELPPQEPALAAVGRGIQAFATVELAMAMVFASIMEPASRANSIMVMEAARHIETKLRIVRAVGRQTLTGEQGDRFTNLINRIGRRVEIRNKLAHWVVSYWPAARTVQDFQRSEAALVPPYTSRDHIEVMSGDQQPVRLEQIEEFASACHALTSELFQLAEDISSSRRAEA